LESVLSAIDLASPLNLTVGTNNRITTGGFSYDLAGNLTADVTSSYAWNAESEIKTANSVNYTYDGDGDRVQKSNGKIYWYGAGTEILDESLASGNITDEYVFFGGKRVAHRTVSSGSITYYAEDMLGSTRVMTTSAGVVCYDADFYPYGGEKLITNTCAQNYKFEGKERDTETGNDDFGARYYSSVYGRWLSPDWSSKPEGVPYADFSDPQSLNLYPFVKNNPLRNPDIDGHCGEPASFILCVGLAAAGGYAIYKGIQWIRGVIADAESKANNGAVDLLTHPNEHTDMDIKAQADQVGKSTLDPTHQAQNTLNGISAGAGVVGAVSGVSGGVESLGEKAIGVVVEGNTKAVDTTAKIAGDALQSKTAGQQQQAPQPSAQQQQAPPPSVQQQKPDKTCTPATGGTCKP
jgi:RHS repeat-associated protein